MSSSCRVMFANNSNPELRPATYQTDFLLLGGELLYAAASMSGSFRDPGCLGQLPAGGRKIVRAGITGGVRAETGTDALDEQTAGCRPNVGTIRTACRGQGLIRYRQRQSGGIVLGRGSSAMSCRAASRCNSANKGIQCPAGQGFTGTHGRNPAGMHHHSGHAQRCTQLEMQPGRELSSSHHWGHRGPARAAYDGPMMATLNASRKNVAVANHRSAAATVPDRGRAAAWATDGTAPAPQTSSSSSSTLLNWTSLSQSRIDQGHTAFRSEGTRRHGDDALVTSPGSKGLGQAGFSNTGLSVDSCQQSATHTGLCPGINPGFAGSARPTSGIFRWVVKWAGETSATGSSWSAAACRYDLSDGSPPAADVYSAKRAPASRSTLL